MNRLQPDEEEEMRSNLTLATEVLFAELDAVRAELAEKDASLKRGSVIDTDCSNCAELREKLSRAIAALKDAVNEDWAKAEEALKELEGQ